MYFTRGFVFHSVLAYSRPQKLINTLHLTAEATVDGEQTGTLCGGQGQWVIEVYRVTRAQPAAAECVVCRPVKPLSITAHLICERFPVERIHLGSQ